MGRGGGASARAACGDGGRVRERFVAGGAGWGKSLVLVSAGLQRGRGAEGSGFWVLGVRAQDQGLGCRVSAGLQMMWP